MDFVRALIGIDRLQVQHVADDWEFERNAAGAMDGTRHTGDFERLGYAIFLGHAHLVGGQAVLVFEAGEVVIHELALGNLQGHVDELFLDELLAGNRHAELHAGGCSRAPSRSTPWRRLEPPGNAKAPG